MKHKANVKMLMGANLTGRPDCEGNLFSERIADGMYHICGKPSW